ADVALQFGHEALAEAHHFIVTLALGIEIGSALAAAHGQRGERILEDLFKRQEFQDAEIHARMETQSALVRTDGAVHLNAESSVDLNVALVVEPRHAEHDHALGLDNSFEQTRRLILGEFRQDQPERIKYFLYCLVEFGLGGILRFYTDHHGFNVVPWNLDSRGCHHRHRSYLRRYNVENIMPLSIFNLYRNGAVIILTGGRDLGHGGCMWSGMRGLRERADRAVMGTSL